MLTIRRLARRFGVSRATLLYYDRIGLLHPSARSQAGYRLYDSDALVRLADIVTYKHAGLSLAEIARVLTGPQTAQTRVLAHRMRELDRQVGALRAQQRAIAGLLARSDATAPALFDKDAWVGVLQAAGLDPADRHSWHQAFERNAPEAHHAFLSWLGIDEAEIAELRRNARDATPG